MTFDHDDRREIYRVYKKLNGNGINEHNPLVRALSVRINQSIEETCDILNQGDQYHVTSNDNVWSVSESQVKYYSAPVVQEFIYLNRYEAPIVDHFNYLDWNKALIRHFFNDEMFGKEIICFPISSDTFKEVSQERFTVNDFIQSLSKALTTNFVKELEVQYKESLPFIRNGSKLRKDLPTYFGFIMFMLYALSEYEDSNLNANNVYARINNYGIIKLGVKWKNITSSVALNILEPAWHYLKDWSIDFHKKKLGFFELRDPIQVNRKYVSRLERHVLLNNKQFRKLFDVLIQNDITVGAKISAEMWINIFETNKDDIPNSKLILSYIKEKSDLQSAVLTFLNSYVLEHFDSETISTFSSKFRTPPTWVQACIKELPQWPDEPIDKVYFRLLTEDVEDDFLSFKNEKILLEHDKAGFSIPLVLDISLDNKQVLKGANNKRYVFNGGILWLEKNHKLNEWIETNVRSNASSFIWIVNESIRTAIPEVISYDHYPIKDSECSALLFSHLSASDFELLYTFFDPSQTIEGKIDLISEFTDNRRKTIFTQFPFHFRYTGALSDPQLVLREYDSGQGHDLIIDDQDTSIFYFNDFEKIKGEVIIYEKESGVRLPSKINFFKLDILPLNIESAPLRDYEGEIFDDFDSENFLHDIPPSFGKERIKPSEFNAWQNNLYNIFKGTGSIEHRACEYHNYRPNHYGNLILKFLSVKDNISTRDFPKLITSFDPSIEKNLARRILIHWRNLGYINFLSFGEKIKVNQTALFFLQSRHGLRGYLSGFRDDATVKRLKQYADNHGLKILIETHSSKYPDLYPQRIILYTSHVDLKKYAQLKLDLNLSFYNNIQHSAHPDYTIYQLACFYTQSSCSDFIQNLVNKPIYQSDHHRKSIFDDERLTWTDVTTAIENLPTHTIVRYDGFSDRSIIHIYIYQEKSYLINDLGIALFSGLRGKNILYKKSAQNFGFSDLYIPLRLPFPYWIEKGLTLLQANVTRIRSHQKNLYRVYENIPNEILGVIENKLDQKINSI